MHELFCMGTKNYETAFQTIQEYNISKEIQYNSSIPTKTGKYKDSRCYFDIVYSIYQDV